MASVDTVDMVKVFWQVISFNHRVIENMYWVGILEQAYNMEETETESNGSKGDDDGEGLGLEQMGVDSDVWGERMVWRVR